MNTIFICALLLALGVCCRAGDETEEFKDWLLFNKGIMTDLCQPEKTCDKVMADFMACRSILEPYADKFVQIKEMSDKLYEKCSKDSEKDVDTYTKVDLKNEEYKKILIGYCSENMHNCIKNTIKEWKDNGELKKPEKPDVSDEDKQKLKDCMAKAVKGE